MIITIIHSNFYPLGAQRAAIRLANNLALNGYGVNFFVLSDEGVLKKELNSKIKIFSPKLNVKIKYLGTLLRSAYFIYLMYQKKSKRIISFTPYLNILGIIFKLFKPKTILICQERALSSAYLNDKYQMSIFASLLQKFFYKYFSRFASTWVFLSEDLKTDFINLFKLKINTFVISNSYDPSLIIEKSKINHDNEKLLNEKKSKFIISVVGRLADQKDPFLALRTILKLKELNLNLECNFIGDGELRGQLERFIEERNLKEIVFFKGYKSNPEFYIKHSNLVLITSRYEGIPNVLLESIALNIPIVTTSFISGPKELLLKYNYNYVSSDRNPETLCNLILKIKEDKKVKESLSVISNKLLEENSQKKISEKYLNLLI